MNKDVQREICIALVIGAVMGAAGFFMAKYLRKPIEAQIREVM